MFGNGTRLPFFYLYIDYFTDVNHAGQTTAHE